MRIPGDAAFRPVTKRNGRNSEPPPPSVVTLSYEQVSIFKINVYCRQILHERIRIHADCLRTSARNQNPAGASA
jgi:hypothetical protein